MSRFKFALSWFSKEVLDVWDWFPLLIGCIVFVVFSIIVIFSQEFAKFFGLHIIVGTLIFCIIQLISIFLIVLCICVLSDNWKFKRKAEWFSEELLRMQRMVEDSLEGYNICLKYGVSTEFYEKDNHIRLEWWYYVSRYNDYQRDNAVRLGYTTKIKQLDKYEGISISEFFNKVLTVKLI